MDFLECNICNISFVSTYNRKRHFRKFHQEAVEIEVRLQRKNIYCPLCFSDKNIQTDTLTYEALNKHLETEHKINLEIEELEFNNKEDFEMWVEHAGISAKYFIRRTTNCPNYKYRQVFYECNRSYSGYARKINKIRMSKVGETIKINGTCPSKILGKFYENGMVKINFTKTHVGHEEDPGCHRLTKMERQEICDKLKNGVGKQRLIEDARKLKRNQLSRVHVLTKKDLRNIEQGILKNRDSDDMTAVAIKVIHEWNHNGKNYGFFFKQLDALKNRIGDDISPVYFMTDDDPKYYNAWIKIMKNQPRHLLCSWHVIKNWNIQGKAKIKKLELKKSMKSEMRKILSETKEENFLKMSSDYFQKLQEEGEVEFLKYLKKYYFQSEERVKMWAHCHRINAGINTNMAIESLNKFIKYDELNKKRNNTIERLLDMLDKVVEDKMWTRIVELHRPSANSYQQRVVRASHKKAENVENNVEETGFGEFAVRSLNCNKIYRIVYGNRMCGSGCKHMYCTVCKICLHRYICDCPQYAVKSTTCKHVHMVALFERKKSESVLGSNKQSVVALEEHNYSKKNVHFNDHTYCKISSIEEVEALTEKRQEEEVINIIDEETFRKIKQETFNNLLDSMSMENFKVIMGKNDAWIKNLNSKQSTKKRKLNKQTYYPDQKQK